MMLFGSRFLKRPAEMTAADRADYNARVGRQVDDFRTFVNMHYMTERDDTPFWREVKAHRLHPETRERLAFWRKEMPKREHFVDFLDGLPHIETQLYYPVLDGLGILDPAVAKAGDGAGAVGPRLRAEDRRQPRPRVQAGGDQGHRPRRVPAPMCATTLDECREASSASGLPMTDYLSFSLAAIALLAVPGPADQRGSRGRRRDGRLAAILVLLCGAIRRIPGRGSAPSRRSCRRSLSGIRRLPVVAKALASVYLVWLAMKGLYDGSLARQGYTSVWTKNRINPVMVRCESCGKMNCGPDESRMCLCGAKLPDAFPYW